MQRVLRLDRVVAPVLLFVCFYVATLFAFGWWRFPFFQWAGLVGVVVATTATVLIWERGKWPLGLFVPPRLAIPELLFGSFFGFALVGLCAVLVVLTTDVHHDRGRGFPWMEVVFVYLPAALHEELLFRGYVFQKLLGWQRGFTLFFAAVVFAGLHAGNNAVSGIGLANIFLGGLLLGLAYELYERLWFPIGVHLLWNITSGPLLGHEVSGYDSPLTVLVERGGGPSWLTGGDFGIEGSVWMTVMELVAIAILWTARRRRTARPAPTAISFSA